MTQITLKDAEAQFSRLIHAARQGEEVVIMEDDKPIARLVPIAPSDRTARPRPRFGSGKGVFQMAPDFDEPLEDFKEYME
jgi:prevent-host-death family protein